MINRGDSPQETLPKHLVTHDRFAAHFLLEEVTDTGLSLSRLQGKSIHWCKVHQSRIGIQNEVSEEPRVVQRTWCLTEEFAQCRQVVFVTDNTQNVTSQKSRTAAGMQQFLSTEQRCNARSVRHVQSSQLNIDAPFFRTESIDEHLPFAGRMNFEPERAMGEGCDGTSTLASLAANGRELPCTISDTSTTKKARLK